VTTARPRLVVVGAGVIGTMHALVGRRLGYEVVQIERDLAPRGASLRNFGLVWVSGRSSGAELDLALRARELWESIGKEVPGVGFRAAGSLTVARSADELQAIELAAHGPGADEREFRLITGREVADLSPALDQSVAGGRVLGGLFCPLDAAVEPRRVLGALRGHLETLGGYRVIFNRSALEYRAHAVRDDAGDWHEGDLVVVCTGAASGGLLADALADAPVRRVRLQMLETEPYKGEVGAALADADSLRYYPAYAGAVREYLAPQNELGAEWGMQLLLVQRLSGHLTIGDTHRYEEPFDFDIADEPTRHLLGVAGDLLGPLPPVERRWSGVYLESTIGANYLRLEVAPGVVVVTAPGGRGMTMSPAIAEETFR
jgi:FAD dependent oxidoreductase TIGR03364